MRGMTRFFMAIGRGGLHQTVVEHLFEPVLFTIFLDVVIRTSIETSDRQISSSILCPLVRQSKVQNSRVCCTGATMPYTSIVGLAQET